MSLFSPLRAGAHQLAHRVVMAPLTRMRAQQPGNVPGRMSAAYYGQRASAGGLLISEATQVSPRGQGYPSAPGIHSAEQVAGWRPITDAVHAEGGLIFLQLWHVGRISHSSFQPDGGPPLAPSAVAPAGSGFTASWQRAPFETPRAIALDEIPSVIAEYGDGARNQLDPWQEIIGTFRPFFGGFRHRPRQGSEMKTAVFQPGLRQFTLFGEQTNLAWWF